MKLWNGVTFLQLKTCKEIFWNRAVTRRAVSHIVEEITFSSYSRAENEVFQHVKVNGTNCVAPGGKKENKRI